jgi:hypothetical protein
LIVPAKDGVSRTFALFFFLTKMTNLCFLFAKNVNLMPCDTQILFQNDHEFLFAPKIKLFASPIIGATNNPICGANGSIDAKNKFLLSVAKSLPMWNMVYSIFEEITP